jgi:hypothetical protein
LVQAFLKKWWVESDFKAPNLPLSLRLNEQQKPQINEHKKDHSIRRWKTRSFLAWERHTNVAYKTQISKILYEEF